MVSTPQTALAGSPKLRDHHSGEQRLWRAVLANALREAWGRAGQPPSGRAQGGEVEQARLWFSLRNPDFHTVCEFAGLDAQRVHNQAWRIIGTAPAASNAVNVGDLPDFRARRSENLLHHRGFGHAVDAGAVRH